MLPNNLQTEKDLIWLMISDASNVPQIAVRVEAEDFYHLTARNNYIIALNSYKKDGIVDYRKLEQAHAYMEDYYVSSLWIPRLCDDLRELSKKRKIAEIADQLVKNIPEKTSEELLKNAINSMAKVNAETEIVKSDSLTIAEKVLAFWKESKDKKIIGASTGFEELDGLIGGFQKGHIWIIGGYTNYGKTTLAISFLSHLIKTTNDPLLFCSIEMSQVQIFEKIISNITRQTPNWNRQNYSLSAVQDAFKKVSNSKLEITDIVNTVEGIIMKIQSMIINGNKPIVVFIDFIQNIQGEGKSEYERITNAITALQIAARKFDVCIVVLSQMNNQSAATTEVMGFKSSGALAAAGDITIQIVRDKVKEIEAAKQQTSTEIVDMGLVIQKNRHGRGGYFPLDFDTTKGLIINH